MDVKPTIDMTEDTFIAKRDPVDPIKPNNDIDVQGMVDDTVRRVREQSDRIQAATLPFANKTKEFAEQQPVVFTFLAIFIALSFIPLCLFIGFFVSSVLFILGVALIGTLVCALAAFIIGAAFLLPVLVITFFLSTLGLAFLLSLFLLHRLYLHITAAATKQQRNATDYQAMSAGARSWFDETVDRLPQTRLNYSTLKLGNEHHSLGTSHHTSSHNPRSNDSGIGSDLTSEKAVTPSR